MRKELQLVQPFHTSSMLWIPSVGLGCGLLETFKVQSQIHPREMTCISGLAPSPCDLSELLVLQSWNMPFGATSGHLLIFQSRYCAAAISYTRHPKSGEVS